MKGTWFAMGSLVPVSHATPKNVTSSTYEMTTAAMSDRLRISSYPFSVSSEYRSTGWEMASDMDLAEVIDRE